MIMDLIQNFVQNVGLGVAWLVLVSIPPVLFIGCGFLTHKLFPDDSEWDFMPNYVAPSGDDKDKDKSKVTEDGTDKKD